MSEKIHLAKKAVSSFSDFTIVDGYGAVVENSLNQYAYDLRLISDKGLLCLNHPLRLKFNGVDTKSKTSFDVTSHPLFSNVITKYPQRKIQISNTLDYLAVRPQDSTLIYSSHNTLLPVDFELKSSSHQFHIPLEQGFSLHFNEEGVHSVTNTKEGYFHAWLNYYFHILINIGRGRLSMIEKILRTHSPSQWQIFGAYIVINEKLNDIKSKCLAHGLFVNDMNLSNDKLTLQIPISIYDHQVKDILTRLKKALM